MNLKDIKGKLFNDELMESIRDKFYHLNVDPLTQRKRLFFDNAGGALRLKSTSDAFKKIDELPDCPEHSNSSALKLYELQQRAYEDIRTIFNAKSGSIVTSLTASMAMFEMARAIIENVPGTNVVTTVLEHPSAYDSAVIYGEKMGKEIRVAKTNPVTGGVDLESIVKLIDKDTCVLSVIYASNISGAILDIEEIIKAARAIKPDLYIICDAVQHVPHGVIDLEKTPVDAINIAPYKMGCPRGIGFGYISERVAKLPHDKLISKDHSVWELGSPASGHFAAISAYVDYICWIGAQFLDVEDRRELFVEGMNRIKMHERALMYNMLNGTLNCKGLRDIQGVTVYLDYEDLSKRDFIMAIGFDNIDYKKAVSLLEEEGVITFERVISSPYSSRMLKSLKFDGCVRVSPLHCHNIEDIENFLKIVFNISKRSII
ncbi:aminotransferase class V-fold PLP-dependent enzyme [Maledivibacter halophilus]|uniref:Selenocysteine lyase/Cysteine desulfurase n=1 Tax=Maledivibacter halophilus TaxID=36842 RepID=A0A1T5IN22_9FIRM|nr:aminotransferase class V-fold PLP-dependent enzyme [Maledivibacter halophilus]SKC40557.1 Selenocysteine lyase/Cysteine desulfurase [Maledivibacter halophilus]